MINFFKIIFAISSLLYFAVNGRIHAQFSTYSKKDKFGIEYDNVLITTAKYDSVIFQDDFIATAYKKKKVFYLDNLGQVISKSGIGSWPFCNGMGVLKNKKGEYAIVDRKGDFLMSFEECLEIKRVDNVILCVTTYFKRYFNPYFISSGTINQLITEKGKLCNDKGHPISVDTMYFENGLVQVDAYQGGYYLGNYIQS